VLEAYDKYPDRIIPFLSTPRWGWQVRDQAFLTYAESQLKTGKFKGMGEFMVRHYTAGGSAPAPDINVPADSQWIQDMMRLGAKYNVPLVIHMETEPDTVAALDRALNQLCEELGDFTFLGEWKPGGSHVEPNLVKLVFPQPFCVVAYSL